MWLPAPRGPSTLWSRAFHAMVQGRPRYGPGPSTLWSRAVHAMVQGRPRYGPGPSMLWSRAGHAMVQGQPRYGPGPATLWSGPSPIYGRQLVMSKHIFRCLWATSLEVRDMNWSVCVGNDCDVLCSQGHRNGTPNFITFHDIFLNFDNPPLFYYFFMTF